MFRENVPIKRIREVLPAVKNMDTDVLLLKTKASNTERQRSKKLRVCARGEDQGRAQER